MMRSLVTFLLLFVIPGFLHAAPVISEIMASNGDTLADNDGDFSDWIEIFNPGPASVNLKGYFLSDDASDLERWEFPDVTMAANSYLVVFASGKDKTEAESELHTGFKLGSTGEYLVLADETGKVVSELAPSYPGLLQDESYALIDVDAGTYEISQSPTPNATNDLRVVIFSVPGRTFVESFQLELSSPSGGEIRYSEDGKAPTLFNGKTYSGPITVDSTKVIAARADSGPIYTQVFIQIDPELADFSSDIPLVVVYSFEGTINSDTTMREMAIGILEPDADSGRTMIVNDLALGSKGGIRLRGESSQGFPKRPYRLEFWDEMGDDQAVAPLGFPAESDFNLNSRYTFDRLLIRNAYSYELSNQIDRYAARTQFVELYVNTSESAVGPDNYSGVYTFMENLKRDGSRVDVSTMSVNATEEPEITGGYLFKKDKSDPGTWNFSGGGESLQMVYPSEEERSERGHQSDWLSDHLGNMRASLGSSDPETGYPAYIDAVGWIDHHLLNVLMLNVDALRISAYFHKDNLGKISAGPVWDFDRSAGSTDGRSANPETWRGSGGDNGTHFFRTTLGTPIWWQDLFEQVDFQQQWADRWHELRRHFMVTTKNDPTPMPAFSAEHLTRLVDEMTAEIYEAQERNFDKWTTVRPRGGYDAEIELLKDWLTRRVEWIDEALVTVPSYTLENTPGEAKVTIEAGGTLFKPAHVYYTTDNTDPRVLGGEVSASAIFYEDPVTVAESTTFVARKRDTAYEPSPNGPDQEWSAPSNVRVYIGSEAAASDNLIVSEIMYNPPGPTEAEEGSGFETDDDFEYLELRNISQTPIDLTGVTIGGDIGYVFPEGYVLGPGAHAVVAHDTAGFAARYGVAITALGPYDDTLGNRGGDIEIRGFGDTLIKSFSYDDGGEWPAAADGTGKTLELRQQGDNPDPSLATNWEASSNTNGTPGTGPDIGVGGITKFQSWKEGQFSEAELDDLLVSGPDADPDGDQWSNLAEFALGGDPKKPDSAERLPTATLDDDGLLVFTYSRPKDLLGISYAVEVSDDLETWENQDQRDLTETVTDNGDGSETVVHREIRADLPKLFARLRIRLIST